FTDYRILHLALLFPIFSDNIRNVDTVYYWNSSLLKLTRKILYEFWGIVFLYGDGPLYAFRKPAQIFFGRTAFQLFKSSMNENGTPPVHGMDIINLKGYEFMSFHSLYLVSRCGIAQYAFVLRIMKICDRR